MTHARRSRLPRPLVLVVGMGVIGAGVWLAGRSLWSGSSPGSPDMSPPLTMAQPEVSRSPADPLPSIFTPEPSHESGSTAQPGPTGQLQGSAVTASQPPKGAPLPESRIAAGTTAPASGADPAAASGEDPQAFGTKLDDGADVPAQLRGAASAGTGPALSRALALLTTEPLQSRRELTRLLESTALTPAERLRAYEAINEVNQPLFFRSGIVQGDDVFVAHRVSEGESPTSIIRALGAQCEPDLLLRINNIADARRIRVGQVLKVPKGPFHAEVRKGEFRLNVFHGEGADRVMIASYPVGLGEFNTTPTGIFKIRPRSKLRNPQWRNPRTGEFFAADDPRNPIGERWIGIEGIEPHNEDFVGYGIHGTIEPESIGRMQSMGCIRMLEADVEVVYELLTVPGSTVVIAP